MKNFAGYPKGDGVTQILGPNQLTYECPNDTTIFSDGKNFKNATGDYGSYGEEESGGGGRSFYDWLSLGIGGFNSWLQGQTAQTNLQTEQQQTEQAALLAKEKEEQRKTVIKVVGITGGVIVISLISYYIFKAKTNE